MNKKFESDFAVNSIFKFCIATGCKFLFVSGNGGAGKSTFAKEVKKEFERNGFTANLIDTDDFVTNSTVRRSAKSIYLDSAGNENVASFSTSFEESYCLNSLNGTIFNLKQKLSFYHIPKKVNDETDYVYLKGTADIHIFEGVGTQFIEKPKNCLSVYIGCDLELEAKRRIARARNGEEKQSFEQVLAKCKERRDKLDEMSIIKAVKFDVILKSNEDFSFTLEKDVFNVIGGEGMNKDCEFAIKVIKQASSLLINDFETIEKGDAGDVVTSLELNIEKYIIKKVKEAYLNFDIISEEFSPDVKLSKNCVIINGIDGSVNVSKKMPIFATQMAIVRDGICTAAVTYLPFLNELYFADEEAAYLNGKKTLVKDCPLEKGLVAATGTQRIKRIMGMEKYGLILRDYGSIAVAFAWVASGKLNGAVYNGNKIWNYYPVLKICERAGAKIVDKKGVHIAASSDEFLNILNN